MKQNLSKPIIMLLLFWVVGCGNKEISLILGSQKSDNGLLEIYQFEDGTKLYSEYTKINYRKGKNETVPLKEGLKNGTITINEIIDQLTFDSSADDGGSMIYQYKSPKNKFANKNFVLIKCNTLAGNRDIIIASSDKFLDYCVNK